MTGLVTDPQGVERLAEEREEENWAFRIGRTVPARSLSASEWAFASPSPVLHIEEIHAQTRI